MQFYALSLALLAVIAAVCGEAFYQENFRTGKSNKYTFWSILFLHHFI